MLSPNDPGEIRDRGLLKAHLGRPGAAIADLETYLTRSPKAPDAESVRGRVSWLRRKLTDLG
jgi:regulator of sirC expression with transglutaminase-like and TPR domain